MTTVTRRIFFSFLPERVIISYADHYIYCHLAPAQWRMELHLGLVAHGNGYH